MYKRQSFNTSIPTPVPVGEDAILPISLMCKLPLVIALMFTTSTAPDPPICTLPFASMRSLSLPAVSTVTVSAAGNLIAVSKSPT